MRDVWRIPAALVIAGTLYVLIDHLALPRLQGNPVDWNEVAGDVLIVPVAALVTLAVQLRHEASRRRADQVLHEREEEISQLLAVSPDAIVVYRVGAITFANAAAAQLVGAETPEQLIGRPVMEFIHPEDRALVGQRMLAVLEDGVAAERTDERFLRMDGSVVNVEVASAPLRGWAEPAVLVLAHDITERRRAATALAASEEKYRRLFENNPAPMWVFDADTLAFLAVNDFAVDHYGYSREEFLAMTIRDIRPPEELLHLVQTLAGQTGPVRDGGVARHRKKNGSVIEVEIAGHDLEFEGRPAVFVLAVDVTERRLLEQQLFQAQKMESVGRLAGGVAHDMNNLLNVVGGYAGLVLDDLGADDPHRGDLEEIVRAQGRAADLTRQLLAFGRRQVFQQRVLDLNAIITGIAPMLGRALGEDVELTTRLQADLGTVRADPGQLEQVLLNLAVNARDAMPEGGTLTITTGRAELSEADRRSHVSVVPGPYVVVTVTDTGTGMDEEVQRHLFEPFFTTKEPGKGTGLGLATTYGIVKQSGGHIWIESRPGQGTSVRIHLPRIAETAESYVQHEATAAKPRGSETILLVEDYEAGRRFLHRTLESLGYRLLTAADGNEALVQAAGHEGPIDLLLTDVVMPGMSGHALARQLVTTRPATRVLYASGYAEDTTPPAGGVDPDAPFLRKPFTVDALAQKVRAVLDA
ncbi:MAG: hybrid sensor histidine kinase/response regulator [Candidatus Limnocylindrales bacterium]